MADLRTLVRDEMERAGSPSYSFDDLGRRRDRKRRNQRIAAGVVGIAVFVAAVWIVTSGLSLDRSETSVVPGGDVTGPAETGPSETGPAETGPSETGPAEIGQGRQGPGSLPVTATDYLVDLETGARTPLPESIVGTEDVTSDYAVSPDGSRLAFTGPIGKGRGKAIFVANLDGTGVEQVTSVDAGVLERPAGGGDPAWSPDGSRIAYVGGRGGWWGNVFVVDLATGATTQVTDEPDGGGTSTPSFTPDGESIVYSSEHEVSEVRIVPITGGRSVRLLGGDGVYAELPVFSPDGSLLSYSCGDEYGSDLCLANADGTDARVLVGNTDGPGSWSPDGTRIAYWRWQSGVYVVDVASGEETWVAEGALPTWLDGHTLIVEADGCSLPPVRGCPF
jgi:Tol biopolymer transport system component